MIASRKKIITGNWKMYKTSLEAAQFIQELIPLIKDIKTLIYLAVPFTIIKDASNLAINTNLVIGAQNMHDATEGSFTGEIAAKMLKEAGAQFVLLGHSERRIYFQESNEFINQKIKRAIEENLQPILCIGESFKNREDGKTEEILEEQLSQCLLDIKEEQLDNLILAYEPVWAIGTNESATPEDAEKALSFCRNWIEKNYSKTLAQKLIIEYGGSVKPQNAKNLLSQPNVDGLLVGGASLDEKSFWQIINETATIET